MEARVKVKAEVRVLVEVETEIIFVNWVWGVRYWESMLAIGS